MTSPNTPTHSDILAARERVKRTVHPAHWPDIDAAKWDPYAKVQGALDQMIREREQEECGE